MFVILFATLVSILIIYVKHAHNYWKRRGFPQLPTKFPKGNIETYTGFQGLGLGNLTTKFYSQMKQRGWKFGGVYLMTRPHLVVVDPELIHRIMTTDFEFFANRGLYKNDKHDPLSSSLFTSDVERWRRHRSKLTPGFSSARIKTMVETVADCFRNMRNFLDEQAKLGKHVDIKDVINNIASDVIWNCAFGLNVDSFKAPHNDFTTKGKHIFHGGRSLEFKVLVSLAAPGLAKILGFLPRPDHVTKFYVRTVKEMVEYREKNNVRRNDLFQLMLDMKNSGKSERWTLKDVMAHSYNTYAAGFDPATAIMAFGLYEIACDGGVQEKLRLEMKGQTLNYETVKDLKYLEQVFNEIVRKYPSLQTLYRKCTKNFVIPGTDCVIEKGTTVLIPAKALHYDPYYYPNPDMFDPERFSEENKQHLTPHTFLPFGEGPRSCIGMRFGKIEVKMIIAKIVKRYKLRPTYPEKAAICLNTFNPEPAKTLYVDFEKIE